MRRFRARVDEVLDLAAVIVSIDAPFWRKMIAWRGLRPVEITGPLANIGDRPN